MKVYNLVSVRHLGQATPKSSNANIVQKAPQRKFKSAYERLGVNMETRVGYDGEIATMPIPKTVRPNIAKFLENLGVDWRTHVGK